MISNFNVIHSVVSLYNFYSLLIELLCHLLMGMIIILLTVDGYELVGYEVTHNHSLIFYKEQFYY